MRVTKAMLAVAALSLLTAGCEYFTQGPEAESHTAMSTSAGGRSAGPAEQRPEGRQVADADRSRRMPPAESPKDRPPPRLPTRADKPGQAVTRMALPSGERTGSAVYVEIAAPKEVLAGEEFDHTITLTNLTRKALTGVVLTETVPKNVKASGTAPQATMAGQVLKWNVGKLGAEESKAFRVRGVASSTGSIVPCCQVTYDIPEVCVAIKVVQPALRIVKTAPSEVILCDPVPVRIVVTNTGTGTARNVKVSDPLPDGMTSSGKKAMSFDVGTLGPGESRKVEFAAKAAKTGEFVNAATAVADGGLQAKSEAVTTTVRLPVLAVTKTAPKLRYVGRPFDYTLTVKNKGDAVAKDTVLVDTLPDNAKLINASAGGKVAGGKATWQLGSLAPNASKTVTLSMMATEIGMIRNTATATAYCAKASARAVTEVRGIPAILLECVDLDDPIEVGKNVTYEITVTNQGSALGTNIVVKCTLPAEQEFVSASGPTKETAVGKAVTFAALKSLAPKAKVTYRLVVKGVGTGDVRFKVSLTSDQMTSPAEETESTNIYK